MPPEEADHNRGYKYPFVVNEVFCCENSIITEAFFIPSLVETDKKNDDSGAKEKSDNSTNDEDEEIGSNANEDGDVELGEEKDEKEN
jgi:hypothetical protein